MLEVALLGTGGMMPLPNRYLSSLLCRCNGSMLLIDCGEGTQISAKILGWGFKNIDFIAFTHFHADHISGLPGMLLAIGNAGRTDPLTIVGPRDLKRVVNSLRVIAPDLPFEIHFHELNFADESSDFQYIDLGEFKLSACRLFHRIPCVAYSIELLRVGKFDVDKALALNLPKVYWSKLQNHEELLFEGRTYTYKDVLGPDRKGIKLCYCTDTRPVKALPKLIEGADLFVCEGLYGDSEKLEKVVAHRHMLFSEAASLAKQGAVSNLWLTHFSPALLNPEEFLGSARAIFPNTKVGFDRMNTVLQYEN